jgi:hypothetical protein
MIKYSALQASSAFLLVTMGSACGSSDANSTGGGDSGNRANDTDGASAINDAGSTDDGSSSGAATSGDASTSADGAPRSDGHNPGVAPVNLGMASSYAILAKSAISTVPTSAITGSLGISPAAASFITGFSLTADATNAFSTSPQVTGKVYAADYAVPTPSNLTVAIGDMQSAFTDAAGRPPGVTELGAGNIGGMTLAPGVYKWGTGLLIPSDLTLAGNATDVWIFQIAQGLTLSSATNVLLTGGALAANVFWDVAGAADVGTTAHLEGVILCKTSIALHTGASIKGRLLAQTAVSVDSSAVIAP